MTQVFISYARIDSAAAKQLYADLAAEQGLTPWLDEFCLLPGIRWRPAIRKAIRESDFFLALCSKQSCQGRGVRHTELDQALEILTEYPQDQIYLIPLRLDDCEPPRDEMAELNWVNLFPDWSAGVTRLLPALRQRAAAAPSPAPPPPPAAVRDAGESDDVHYHYRVGLADLGLGLDGLGGLAQQLTQTQRFFRFSTIRLPDLAHVVESIEGQENLNVSKIDAAFFAQHRNPTVDLIACLTPYPLAFEEDERVLFNYFSGPSDVDERFLFVSADQLRGFAAEAGRTFQQALIHVLAGQIVQYFTKTGYHAETRGCVMDFCERRADIVVSLRSRGFCSDCAPRLTTPGMRGAIQALLDWTPQ